MRRCTLRLIALYGALLALILGAIGAGQARAEHSALRELGFDRCGSGPCLWGVAPGMDWLEARSILAAYGFRDEEAGFLLRYDSKSVLILVRRTRRAERPTVESITFSDYQRSSLGEVIAFWGTPCKIAPAFALELWLPLPSILVKVIPDGGRVSMTTPIKYFMIVDPAITPYVFSVPLCGTPHESPARWAGFASFRYYRSHGIIQ